MGSLDWNVVGRTGGLTLMFSTAVAILNVKAKTEHGRTMCLDNGMSSFSSLMLREIMPYTAHPFYLFTVRSNRIAILQMK